MFKRKTAKKNGKKTVAPLLMYVDSKMQNASLDSTIDILHI